MRASVALTRIALAATRLAGCLGCACGPEDEPTCGNEVREPGEQCDGQDLGGLSCFGQGFEIGTVTCLPSCTADLSDCSRCGDGVASGAEACDGAALRGESCVSVGFAGGSLGCVACALDTSGCYECGDGVRFGDEECDGPDLAGTTCQGLNFESGSLVCGADCRFDTTACVPFNPWSVQFDGTDDSLSCTLMFPSPLYSHTWEGWVWIAPGGPSPGTVFQKWNPGVNLNDPPWLMWVFYFHDTSPVLDLLQIQTQAAGSGLLSEYSYAMTGSWHHFAFVWDYTVDLTWVELRHYVDGLLVLTDFPSPISASSPLEDSLDPLFMGNCCLDGPCTPFEGSIDEIRLWDYPRVGEEIMADMNLQLAGNEPGLIAYWPFDEGSGQFTEEVVSGTTCVLGTGPAPDGADPVWSADTPF
ncbi:MAG TPA: LamG-like jellyroll fold domain-containing protein [Myxococcota bacterium]|jgi:hypothetical protein|nr:LamG-like jellyroll fold domain-containing protein [Myxococcota bacterium]